MGREKSLADLRPALESASGEELLVLVRRALELTRYPDGDEPIPLPADLTPPQRELATFLAERAGVDCLGSWAIPRKVQQRRRWLGIDPPSLLERPVQMTVSGKKIERPLWWACQELLARDEGAHIPALITPAELFQLAVEVSLWQGEIYGIGFGYPAEWLDPYALAEDGSQAAWAASKLDEVATWPRPTPLGTVDGIAYAGAPSGQGLFDPPLTLDATKSAFAYLFFAVASGGGTIRAAWEPFLPWAGPPLMPLLLAAVPEERRDEAAISAFRRTLPKSALETAFAVLPAYPSAPLVEAVRERLASPDLAKGPSAALLPAWRKRWAALADALPASVWRPLGANAKAPASAGAKAVTAEKSGKRSGVKTSQRPSSAAKRATLPGQGATAGAKPSRRSR